MPAAEVGRTAPDFALPCACAGHEGRRLARRSDFAGRWLALISYPRDFSFVCPTELTAFSARLGDFEKRDCRLLGVSVDPVELHREWLATPPSQGGVGPLRFPLASDGDGAAAPIDAASPFPALDPARLGVNVRAGMSYSDVPDVSLFGGSYGVDGGYQLLGDWGFTGSAFASHQSGASQFVGTLGLTRLPSYYADNALRRVSFACLFDQYTDSRQELYLTQLRFQTGYALSRRLELGALYAVPISDDDVVALFDPINFVFLTAPVQMTQGVGGYVAARFGRLQWSGQVVYNDDPDGVEFLSSGIWELRPDVALYAGAGYGERLGTWSTSLGIEYRLGARRRRPTVWGGEPAQVVRAQSNDAGADDKDGVRQASHLTVPRDGPGGDPPESGFSAADLNPTLNGSAPPDAETWADRYNLGFFRVVNLQDPSYFAQHVGQPQIDHANGVSAFHDFQSSFTLWTAIDNGDGTRDVFGVMCGTAVVDGSTLHDLGGSNPRFPNADMGVFTAGGPNVPINVLHDGQTTFTRHSNYIEVDRAIFQFPSSGGYTSRFHYSGLISP